jgi:hypothetical protein
VVLALASPEDQVTFQIDLNNKHLTWMHVTQVESTSFKITR